MKKIISLFQRNYETDRLVRNEVVPSAGWVLNGEGTATQKHDGTSCMVQDGKLYRRFDAKHGKTPPADFMPAQPEPDPVTGHWPGWLPVDAAKPADRWHVEAFNALPRWPDGTYELIGPKVQGNPEHAAHHTLIPHGSVIHHYVPRDFDGIRIYLATHDIEGIVWWRDMTDPDCDLVKIKGRDFGLQRGAVPLEAP